MLASSMRATLLVGTTVAVAATLIVTGVPLPASLATLLVTAVALTTLLHGALRPLERASRDLAAIDAHDLAARVDASRLPAELRPVVQRVNELLSRLEGAFARERSCSGEVAHELRAPLAGLRSTLEATLSRPRSAEEHGLAARECLRAVEQLHAMAERLHLLARLDAGHVTLDVGRVDLAQLAVEVWEPFARPAADRSLVVAFDVDPAGVELRSDRALLTVVLRDLYENAVAHADVAGRVRVTVRRRDEHATLEVSNSGSRLSQDEALASTQRFWRGEAARSGTTLHCGLGLSVVEEAGLVLGGRLVLLSTRGGDFTAALRLPLEGTAARSRAPS